MKTLDFGSATFFDATATHLIINKTIKTKYEPWTMLISGQPYPNPCTTWISVRTQIGRANDLLCHLEWSSMCAPSTVFAVVVGIFSLWFGWHSGKLSPIQTLACKFDHLCDAISTVPSINQWCDPNVNFPWIPLLPFRMPSDKVSADFWHFQRDFGLILGWMAVHGGGNPLTNASGKKKRTKSKS